MWGALIFVAGLKKNEGVMEQGMAGLCKCSSMATKPRLWLLYLEDMNSETKNTNVGSCWEQYELSIARIPDMKPEGLAMKSLGSRAAGCIKEPGALVRQDV